MATVIYAAPEVVMGFEKDPRRWAVAHFGDCELGDLRRTDRLVDYAARQAVVPNASTSRACSTDDAAREGAYRLLRNPRVKPSSIDDAAFDHVAELAREYETVLAIQDTTGVSFTHPMTDALKTSGNPTGFVVHATLLVDAASAMPIGVVDQERWIRSSDGPGRATYESRPYEEKESYKWERASERVRQRTHGLPSVITVCDREADVYEFLAYQLEHGQRFVVRASANRFVEPKPAKLWASVERQQVLGARIVHIEQRGGQNARGRQQFRLPRERRSATATLRCARVEVRPPAQRTVSGERRNLELNAVLVHVDAHAGEPALEWMLLTTEPVATLAQAERVVAIYEQRWLIEEYFKAWKSGCRVETRPLHSLDNLERMMAITAHVAVRLLQLRALAAADDSNSCETVFSRDEWRCLHVSVLPQRAIPKKTPTIRWALEAVARLGGWANTKRTGKIGWPTLWHGWDVFQQRLAGYRAAMRLAHDEM